MIVVIERRVGPVGQRMAIFLGDAHQPCDGLEGQLRGDVGEEVA
jgi:hypothetical protein